MEDVTRLATEGRVAVASSGADWGRFAPGTLFAGRFRIVAPLGRGGMGEVYRAEDLTLGQTVALKLLPAPLATDPARLAQFHNEVRLARTISHRNVCRVYDIGDAGGMPFLTMEYVDGEDLASLLHRIGRYPHDRAVEVARQICAGVAAAHERGVLHRDLKPANVMIDGDGHVRITDFGLAAVSGSADNIRAGTPAYMAPEQLAGREVTQRSDIYALGLVLFELFTGRRVFEVNSLQELIALHQSDSVATPSSVVAGVDPSVERAILRCLHTDPAQRPPSALAVAAALPGGNQLAATLAAGETPSPEMVAAAGEQSALQPAIGLALVGVTVAMLAVLALLSQRYSVVHRIPLPKSADSLRDRGQELIERFGYTDAPYDRVSGWSFSREYLAFAGQTRADAAWPALSSGRTGTATFWYRTSPQPLVSTLASLYPTSADPPLVMSDMRMIRLDPAGRLIEFHSIPPQMEDAGSAAPAPDWAPLFEAAGLSLADFRAAEPRWMPRGDADARAAWEGPMAGIPGVTIRAEAAAYRGRPIFFALIAPWTRATHIASPPAASAASTIGAVADLIGLLILAAAAFLARKHYRTGRADRTGAFHTAALVFVCHTAGWLLRARHFAGIEMEDARVTEIVGLTLVSSSIVWLLYMAFEPYVRRFWPELLIGWTRLLSGRLRDPFVGRDILVGAVAGTIASFIVMSRDVVPQILGHPQAAPQLPPTLALMGTRFALGGAFEGVPRAFRLALDCACIVVFLRIVVRRTWLVLLLSAAAILPIALAGQPVSQQPGNEITAAIAGIALVLGVLLRFGFLSLVVTFYTFLTMELFPPTTDWSRPYAGAAALLLIAIAAVSAYGFYASRGDEPLLGRTLLE